MYVLVFAASPLLLLDNLADVATLPGSRSTTCRAVNLGFASTHTSHKIMWSAQQHACMGDVYVASHALPFGHNSTVGRDPADKYVPIIRAMKKLRTQEHSPDMHNRNHNHNHWIANHEQSRHVGENTQDTAR